METTIVTNGKSMLTLLTFLTEFDLSRHEHHARASLTRFVSESTARFEGHYRQFERFVRNRITVHVGRITTRTGRGGPRVAHRRHEAIIRQVNAIRELPRVDSVSVFGSLVAAFRESGPMAYSTSDIVDSYAQGGLDGLHADQQMYRDMGVLADATAFEQGGAIDGQQVYGTVNCETTSDPTACINGASQVTSATGQVIRSARIPAGQQILAYAARIGYACQRFRSLCTGQYGYLEFEIDRLHQMEFNYFLSLTFAAQHGAVWDRFARMTAGSGRGYGIITILSYLSAHNLRLSEIRNVGQFRFPNLRPPTRQHFNNKRNMMAIWMAANITAMELQYQEWLAAQVAGPPAVRRGGPPPDRPPGAIRRSPVVR